MAGRGARGGRRRIRRRLRPVIAVLGVFLTASLVAALFMGRPSLELSQAGPPVSRAAIIDGLSEDLPNPGLISRMARLLESAGYTVTVFNGSSVNVELFRKLPTLNYSLIIMRLHGGRIMQPIGLHIGSGIFAEPFDESRYQIEYYSGYLLKGISLLDGREYFVIPPHYVSDRLEGRFPGSAIFVLSCYSMWDDVLASALAERGASIVVGVDGPVTDRYVDDVGLKLAENLSRGLSVSDAVYKTMEEVGRDPVTGAGLRFYAGSNLR